MRRTASGVVFVLMAGAAAAQQAPSPTQPPIILRRDSLLGPSGRSPYAKHVGKAYQVRDHIKIIVQERARARLNADFNNDKRARTEIRPRRLPRLDSTSYLFPELKAAELAGDPEVDVDARYRVENRGRTGRDFDLTTEIMAQVVDVKPNGTVVLEAKKTRRVNEEEEVIRITGEASPQFIVNDSITTANMINLRIEYNGEGAVSDSADQGFFGWLVSKWWPF
jgi:flagellar L-ring protein precursor FlgH